MRIPFSSNKAGTTFFHSRGKGWTIRVDLFPPPDRRRYFYALRAHRRSHYWLMRCNFMSMHFPNLRHNIYQLSLSLSLSFQVEEKITRRIIPERRARNHHRNNRSFEKQTTTSCGRGELYRKITLSPTAPPRASNPANDEARFLLPPAIPNIPDEPDEPAAAAAAAAARQQHAAAVAADVTMIPLILLLFRPFPGRCGWERCIPRWKVVVRRGRWMGGGGGSGRRPCG